MTSEANEFERIKFYWYSGIEWKWISGIILGIEGRGGERARCEFTKVNEMLRNRSSNGGNGAKCAKYFLAVASSAGK